MKGRRKGQWPFRVLALAALALPAPCYAQPESHPAQEAPSQPWLGQALEDFGRRFDFDVIYPESLVRGVRAGGAGSADSPQRALEQVLQGTGLVARFTRPDAIILEGARAASAPDMTLDPLEVRAPRAGEYEWYGQRLLEASLGMLRGSAALARKPYDLFVYVWVDDDGNVTDLRVYGAAGEEREASAASSALRSLKMQTPPPLHMPQPVGLRIASH